MTLLNLDEKPKTSYKNKQREYYSIIFKWDFSGQYSKSGLKQKTRWTTRMKNQTLNMVCTLMKFLPFFHLNFLFWLYCNQHLTAL